jgi:hypothetical protein
MLREQVLNFLETAVVLLTLTNALSIAAAAYAISLARGVVRSESGPATEHRLLAVLARRLRLSAANQGGRP